MENQQRRDLIRRIIRLAKQNKELHEQMWQLIETNGKLSELVEKYERRLGGVKGVAATATEDQGPSEVLKFRVGTVLYVGVQGFNELSAREDAQLMMDELDGLFLEFDLIVKKYRLEKMKTIGDTYMCAGGVPERNSTNPVDVVMAAMEMLGYLEQVNRKQDGNRVWDFRIGVHTGPVTAVANGRKKVSWELKGDTVNIASRLSSSSEPGSINISANTYEVVKEFFTCEYNGRIPAKYTGEIGMYYVRGILPEYSVNGDGMLPNAKFDTRFKLLQFMDLQEIILDKLEKELPGYLYYHNVKHTIDVVTEVELIGWAEGVSEEDVLLLKTAALFHDSGHTIGYDDHEEAGCRLVEEFLPRYNYSQKQIEKICELIMATRMPPNPRNLLEKIMCDSDLDYLGRSDFIPVSNSLYEELREQDKVGSIDDWNKLQIKFISGHQYYTQTARNLREVNKQKQIERIKKLTPRGDTHHRHHIR